MTDQTTRSSAETPLPSVSTHPVLPLRDVVMLPGVRQTFFIGRAASLKALEAAQLLQSPILLVTQTAPDDQPMPDRLRTVGTLCMLASIYRLPDGTLKAEIDGLYPVDISAWHPRDGHLAAAVTPRPQSSGEHPVSDTLRRALRQAAGARSSPELAEAIAAAAEADDLWRVAAMHPALKLHQRQALLEISDGAERAEQLATWLGPPAAVDPAEVQVEAIALQGFDPAGEPEIRRMANGWLWLVFDFMPPLWAAEDERASLGRFADFDQLLEAATGTRVEWDDREVFLIRDPEPDTIERIQRFLSDFRRRNERPPC